MFAMWSSFTDGNSSERSTADSEIYAIGTVIENKSAHSPFLPARAAQIKCAFSAPRAVTGVSTYLMLNIFEFAF